MVTHPKYLCVHFQPSWYEKDSELLLRAQQRLTKMMRRLKHPPSEDVLRDLGLFCLEKKKLREIRVYEYLKGGYKEDGARIFSVIPSDRT